MRKFRFAIFFVETLAVSDVTALHVSVSRIGRQKMGLGKECKAEEKKRSRTYKNGEGENV